MAGDWIKMRGALLDNPKVIAMGRRLQNCRAFRDWMTPGGAGPMNGQIVSAHALRCVTTALLMRCWSVAREHGQFVGNDLNLPHSSVDDLDEMAGAPGVGKAMEAVGWATDKSGPPGLTLPNFIEFNVPMTNAEKQAEYRNRKKSVTPPLPTQGNETGGNVTTREEREKSKSKTKARTRAARKARTSLPEGFAISERVKTWATVKGHGRLDQHLEAFLGKVAANGYVYADWDDAFMNCIREDWGKVNSGKPVSLVASHASHAPAKVPELGPHTEMPDAIREQLAQFVGKVAAR